MVHLFRFNYDLSAKTELFVQPYGGSIPDRLCFKAPFKVLRSVSFASGSKFGHECKAFRCLQSKISERWSRYCTGTDCAVLLVGVDTNNHQGALWGMPKGLPFNSTKYLIFKRLLVSEIKKKIDKFDFHYNILSEAFFCSQKIRHLRLIRLIRIATILQDLN